MKNLQTKLNLIENHQNIVSEEIYQSLHSRDVKMEKDSNNNTATSTTPTTNTISTKVKSKIDKTTIQKPIDIKNSAVSSGGGKSVKIVEQTSGTNTLKRKRETKSPTNQTAAPCELSKKQQQHQDQQSELPSPTVATILVSKTKTKSGLPLLLKK